MSIQITIRNVPQEVRDELAARAARAGKSMQEYLRELLEGVASRPSIDEWMSRIRRRKGLSPRTISADTILGHRDADRK